MKVISEYTGKGTIYHVIINPSEPRSKWIYLLSTPNRDLALSVAAGPELLHAITYAKKRLEASKQYGPDMASSRDVCIEDAISLLERALAKAEGRD